LLGLVVTLTHSGSVILLGVLSSVAAALFVPETVQKVLEIVSGLLVLAVGGWMLVARTRGGHGHGHRHPHSHDAAGAHGHSHEPGEADQAHHEGPGGTHGHGDHDHGDHDHGDPLSPVSPGRRPGLGQLIALGVSGGIVPCPAALAVLLAAVSYGQFAQGISLVLVFSLGMAAVLVAIGILMVKAAGLAGRYVGEGKWTKSVPIFSAALITILGVGLTAKAVLDLV
jgi:nickel/cobalt exporter